MAGGMVHGISSSPDPNELRTAEPPHLSAPHACEGVTSCLQNARPEADIRMAVGAGVFTRAPAPSGPTLASSPA
jgi:hypothetical protein